MHGGLGAFRAEVTREGLLIAGCWLLTYDGRLLMDGRGHGGCLLWLPNMESNMAGGIQAEAAQKWLLAAHCSMLADGY